MKMLPIAALIALIEKKLSSLTHDTTLRTQYAWWLVQAITGKNDIVLLTQNSIEWGQQEEKQLDKALDKLINQHMPLQYLLGSTPFCGLDILVKPPTLIPRPETEEWCFNLIEQLACARNEQLTILDICSGSGCIALALADALPKAHVYGTDISQIALELAKENAHHNHIPNATFLYSDLFSHIKKGLTFDLIVSNPPYIPEKEWPTLDKSVTAWEDKNALIAADNGMAIIKQIISQAPEYIKLNETLKKNNIPQLVIEIDYTQAHAVANYFKHYKYEQILIQKDLEGKERIVSGRIDHVALTKNSK